MRGLNGRQGVRRGALLGCCSLLLGTVFSSALRAQESALSGPAVVSPRALRDLQLADAALKPSTDMRGQRAEAVVRPGAHSAPSMEERITVAKRPSSTRAARKAAIDALPMSKISEPHRRRLQQLVNEASVFRELPGYQFEIDPRVYRFFINRPEVAVSIWRVMQISEFQMMQTGPDDYETNDGAGTSGVIDVAYRSDNESVVLCEGVYKSPLLPKPIKALGALHVQSKFERRADGKPCVTHWASLFISFPSQTVDTAAKIVSPISYSIIDQNFREVSVFLHMMSVAMERQPGWVENVSSRLEGVLPARKSQLMEVTVQVYTDANPKARRKRAAEGDLSEPEASESRPQRRNRAASRRDLDPRQTSELEPPVLR